MGSGDRDLDLNQAQAYLARKGVDWKVSHLKAQMACGKLRGVKGESIRVVRKSDLDRIIQERRSKQQ